MKKINMSFFILVLFFSSLSYGAELAELHDDTSIKESKNTKNDSTLYGLVLGYQNTATTINHTENAVYANFYSINKSLEIEKNSFDLLSFVELLQNKTLSATIILRAGLGFGGDEGALNNANFSYKEKYSEKHIGAGLSLNYNTTWFGFKTQPFISGLPLYSTAKFKTNYGASDNTTKFSMEYDVKEVFFETSAGLRFYDFNTSLMSFIALNHQTSLNQKTESRGIHAGDEFEITNGSVESSPLGFSLGMGMFF